ncbi:MAG: plasmid pRiA4b ORF-3 family protein [Bacteroidales bacterium]|nr:plasmid pRiA4b ORF-3 family protein [Bacteroidales bacterium]MCF8456112.1 plasmid pRiA4b ORF-3 family protein [Bacteroidales bacterium]
MKSIYQIKISLIGSKPPIWREVLVPSNILMPDLHDVIQITMGWSNSHMHQFVKDRQFFGPPLDDDDWGSDTIDYNKYKLDLFLKKEKDKLVYEYDFGDSWRHDIVLQKILPYDAKQPLPFCIKGKNNCPPEDCGGVWGYADMLEILKDPKHEEYDDYLDWLGEDFDPEYFDVDEVNDHLS